MSFQNGGKPDVMHPSVGRLLADHPGETDPEQLIRKLARKRVAYAKKHGWEGPSFCPIILASLSNVICNEVHHDIGGDGRIILSREGRPIIEYRSGYLRERQRFTIFHEYAHMLFTDFCEFAPHHHALDESESAEHRQFENLCDIAAAEMMMPVENFGPDILKYNRFDAAAVRQVATRYEASLDATISRLGELGGHVPFLAAFLTDQRAKYTGSGPLWVKYIKKSKKSRDFIWPGTCPPDDSVVYECLKDKTTTRPKREQWTIKGKLKSFLVEAIKLPDIPTQPGYSKVVALFS
jgi:Zn-dependent peptidase ImmA (M78 family)